MPRYQEGSIRQIKRAEGMTWVLRYYTTRADGKRVRFLFNGCAYGATLLIRSVLLRKPSFFGLFLEAQSDGRNGRLGLKYDLPQ